MSMKIITVVTGNPGKLAEWRRLFPDDFQLEAADIDLDEIQSLDFEAIVVDKAKRAYEMLHKPLMVEDISAGLDKLGGMPGPFIKFFGEAVGVKDMLLKIGGEEGDPATVIATIAYYDGKQYIVARGEVKGCITADRGTKGFGFDPSFIPNGQSKTFAEMTPQEKDSTSHRSIAIKELAQKLRAAQL
jgi:non-canonical purine NTP pyrophosphatase (RdgB/HAM1 family)